MSQEPPDRTTAIANALPGIDAESAMLLLRAGRLGRLVELYRSKMASLDGTVDTSGHSVLGALLMLGPPHRLSPTFLSKYVVQTSGGMTKTLRRLEADGLVRRVPDERDGRVSHVELTPKGEEVAERTLSLVLAEWQGALRIRGIDVDEAMATVTQLVEALESLTGARLGRDFGI